MKCKLLDVLNADVVRRKKGDIPAKCVIKDELNDELDDIEKPMLLFILADRNNLFSRNKVHAKFF